MDERRKRGLSYYYDDKYSLGHKCKELRLFQIGITENSFAEEAPCTEVTKEEEGEPLTHLDIVLQLCQMGQLSHSMP